MSPIALVIDQHAVGMLGNAIFEDEWFVKLQLPASIDQMKRVAIAECVYLLSNKAADDSLLLVVRLGPDGVFANAPSRRHLFDRLIHVSLAQFDRTLSIPLTWKAFNEDSRLSIYAQPGAYGKGQRLYVDRNPCNSKHVYAYALTQKVEDFEDVPVDWDCFDLAEENYIEAVLTDPEVPTESGAFRIVLTERIGISFLGKATLEEWYEKKLTRLQRNFVDRGLTAPVRLKGAAGTGKTLSLAIKCLRDLFRFEDEHRNARVSFLTHSSALVPGIKIH